MNRTSCFLSLITRTRALGAVFLSLASLSQLTACAVDTAAAGDEAHQDAARLVASFANETTVSILSDGRFAYVSTRRNDDANGAGSVLRIPSDGGDPIRLADAESAIGSLAQDERALYWTNPRSGEVRSVSKWGGAVKTLGRDAGMRSGSGGIAVDESHVYFTTDLAVKRVPKNGGAVALVLDDPNKPDAIVVDGDSIYWVDRGTGSSPEGRIVRLQKNGDEAELLGTATYLNQLSTWSLAVDDEALYWADPHGERIVRLDKATRIRTVVSAEAPAATSVTSDGTSVFWSARGENLDSPTLFRAPVTGGPAVAVKTTEGSVPNTLSVDSTRLYFSTDGGRAIYTVAK